MSDATEREEALALLIDWAEPSVSPTLTFEGEGNELEAILDRHRVAVTWSSGIEIKAGQVIRPTTSHSRWFRAKTGGTTGASEPSWPSNGNSSFFDNDILFEDGGEAGESIYDVRAAAWEAWDKKARKSSKFPSMTGTNVATIHDHCVQMRDSFRIALVA